MPPTSKKLMGHTAFGLFFIPCLCLSCFLMHAVSYELCNGVHARVLKFHIWIPHEKIADLYFFSYLSCLPFWSYAPLKKSE